MLDEVDLILLDSQDHLILVVQNMLSFLVLSILLAVVELLRHPLKSELNFPTGPKSPTLRDVALFSGDSGRSMYTHLQFLCTYLYGLRHSAVIGAV